MIRNFGEKKILLDQWWDDKQDVSITGCDFESLRSFQELKIENKSNQNETRKSILLTRRQGFKVKPKLYPVQKKLLNIKNAKAEL